MFQKFFQIYGDPQTQQADTGTVRDKLFSPTGREVEAHAGVRYDDILEDFPDHSPIDRELLSSLLTDGGGRGTPLSIPPDEPDEAEESPWVPFGIEGLDDIVSGMMQSCGMVGKTPHRGFKRLMGTGCQ